MRAYLFPKRKSRGGLKGRCRTQNPRESWPNSLRSGKVLGCVSGARWLLKAVAVTFQGDGASWARLLANLGIYKDKSRHGSEFQAPLSIPSSRERAFTARHLEPKVGMRGDPVLHLY